MNQLESNIEEKISEKIQVALKRHHPQVKEEDDMLRVDIKEDLDAMNTKIEIVQKSYEDLAKTRSDNDSPTSKTNNHANIVIKNLEYIK